MAHEQDVILSLEDDIQERQCDIITPAMLKEESETDYAGSTGEDEALAVSIPVEERIKRLTLLLQKSKIYAKSLLEIIDRKKEMEKKKALKKQKKLQQKGLGSESDGIVVSTSQKRPATCTPNGSRTKRAKLTLHKGENDPLEEKLYLPKSDDIVDLVKVTDGIRYLGDTAIDASQPSLLTGGVLRDYQVVGYQWLKILFSNAVNGILADEMGLGKTIQCIALICQIVKTGFKGPFLVIGPLSTLGNWMNEFKMFAPSIPLLLYHGSIEERQILARHILDVSESTKSHPVVITSYEIVVRDRLLFAKHHWEYMVLDEGHRIKNLNSRLLQELKQLNIGTKLLLTGTPLQNNLKELWALLNFIIPEVFDDLQVFESWFEFGDSKVHGMTEFSLEQEAQFLTHLYEILTPFLLRRVKDDVGIDLPPKSEVIVYAPLSKRQEQLYNAAVNKTIRNLLGNEASPTSMPLHDLSNDGSKLTRSKTKDARMQLMLKNKRQHSDDSDINASLNNIMMLLRKCCNHPYLIEYPLLGGTVFKIDEDIVSHSGKMMVLDRMLPKLIEKGHKLLIFSQMVKMLDILEDYLRFRHYSFVRLDGSSSMADRQLSIKNFNTTPSVFAFLLSTRAGGLGINLTMADTVIIFDSDWNPQNDLQAQDRCHRIGQTRPVMVYRFVTSSSVDQRMVERASEKRKLERMVIHQSKFKGHLDVELRNKMKIGKNEVLQMIQSVDFNTVIDPKKALTDAELERILDRTSLLKETVAKPS